MFEAILQLWEFRSLDTKSKDTIFAKSSIFKDGCSLHIDSDERLNYLKKLYSFNNTKTDFENIPLEYEVPVDCCLNVYVKPSLFKILQKDKTIRLSEVEFNNLLNMGEIIINKDE